MLGSTIQNLWLVDPAGTRRDSSTVGNRSYSDTKKKGAKQKP